jgi:hypothetical protein
MEHKEIGCEDGRWMEQAQDCVQWWAMELVVLNLWVLLPESQLISEKDLKEMGCDSGRWMDLLQEHVEWWASLLTV